MLNAPSASISALVPTIAPSDVHRPRRACRSIVKPNDSNLAGNIFSGWRSIVPVGNTPEGTKRRRRLSDFPCRPQPLPKLQWRALFWDLQKLTQPFSTTVRNIYSHSPMVFPRLFAFSA